MSFISNILPSIQVQNAVVSETLFDLAAPDRFYVSCNRALRDLKQFSRKVTEAKLRIRHCLDNFEADQTVPDMATGDDELDRVAASFLDAEKSLARDWEMQRRYLDVIAYTIRNAGGMKKTLLNRVQHATDNVYREAVTAMRDGRVRFSLLRADIDELEEELVSTPEQLRSYFSRSAHG